MGIFDSIKRSVRKARRTIVHHTKDLAKKGSEGFKDLTTKGDPSKLVSLANKGIGTVSKLHNRLANDPNFGSIYEFSNVGKAVKTGLDKAEQGKYLIEKHGDLANKAKGALDDIRKGDIKSANLYAKDHHGDFKIIGNNMYDANDMPVTNNLKWWIKC